MDATPNVKDLTGAELLSDVPELFLIAQTAATEFSGPPPTTAVGWVTKLGFQAGGLVHGAAAAYDSLHAGPVTVDTVAVLLGLTPEGLLDKVRGLTVKVIAQAND